MLLTKKIKQSKKILPQGFLCWKKEGYTQQIEIKHFLSIGRGENNQLVLDNSYVSRNHVRIEYDTEKEQFILKDMKSRNGVFLNENRIYQAVLDNNDLIRIGDLNFTFSFEKYRNKWQLDTQSENEKWNNQLSRVPHLAKSTFPVLLLGGSGTGKEIMAQMIHKNSTRSNSPMVSINCGALTENLINSELFGHMKGSYTGAVTDRKGAFLSANGGTLFLDEIGELPLHLQSKLLRALECQEIKPVGSDKVFKIDVRMIAATHQDLKSKIKVKEFREDLYYRLNVVSITLPDLKDRMEDFNRFLEAFSMEYGVSFSSLAIKELKKYSWPGNIRELKNFVSRAKALFTTNEIKKEDVLFLLDGEETTDSNQDENLYKESLTLKEIEQNVIKRLLKKHNGRKVNVASELGIPRSTLNDKLTKYDIDAKQFKSV